MEAVAWEGERLALALAALERVAAGQAEHSAVLAPARALATRGFEVTEVGVDRGGRVDPAELAAMGAITHGSVRVSFLRDAADAEVDRLLAVLPAAVAELREMADLDSQALDRAVRERR